MHTGGDLISGSVLHKTLGRLKNLTYTLLQHAADQTAGRLGTVFQRGGGGISVEATHCHAEKGAAG